MSEQPKTTVVVTIKLVNEVLNFLAEKHLYKDVAALITRIHNETRPQVESKSVLQPAPVSKTVNPSVENAPQDVA